MLAYLIGSFTPMNNIHSKERCVGRDSSINKIWKKVERNGEAR